MKKIITNLLFVFIFLLAFGCVTKEPTKETKEPTPIETEPAPVEPETKTPVETEEPTSVEHVHEYGDTWEYDSEYHYKSCLGCEEVLKEKHNILDGKCTICDYVVPVTKYVVKFFGMNDVELSSQEVEEHSSAVAPEDPNEKGYVFIGWDKDFNDVTSDLNVNAIFELINSETEYTISYDLSDGVWGYKNKQEYVLAFLNDFYKFCGINCSLHDFLYDASGNLNGLWVDQIGGSVGNYNKLLYNNDIDANNDDYFFNSSEYKEKWYELSSYVRDKVCDNNKRFGGTGGYTYGALDFQRYITDDPYNYIDIYGGNSVFYGYPQSDYEPTLLTYKASSEDIMLPVPKSSRFAGWYIGDELVECIKANTTGNLELVAKWNPVPVYKLFFDVQGGESIDYIELEFGTCTDLPTPKYEGMNFGGWFLNGTRLGSDFAFVFEEDVTIVAKWYDPSDVQLVDLIYGTKAVTYRNSSMVVQIPNQYVQPETQFRAAWVSSYAGDYTPSTNKTTMMKTLTDILNVLESFHMNAIIFHIRTHNDAFYKTKMTVIKSSYGDYSTFETWDYLTWFIGECHKRNIEFHAWLNPYRVASSGATIESITNKWASYPDNPASKAENLLINSDGSVILNPCLPNVRKYIVDICLEVMKNYDVDAIHFDDYFYVKNIDDTSTREIYNINKLTIDDFRREQVDIFIKQLSDAMREFNKDNNRQVQLGISPTGIYRNGNGSVETGSNTSGYAHYGSPLYADTLKWAKNEWIDYILPQSYWGFTHSSAGYADVMDWWNKACAGSRCNLYSGIGIYMNNNNGGNYSWGTEPYEVANQILYTTKLENCQGISFYKYTSIRDAYRDSSSMANLGMKKIVEEYWTTNVPTPKTIASGK